ncbi:MAG: site-specific DNA-methyltransferase [Bacteroidota bacterium]|jgi:DNA modification methylase
MRSPILFQGDCSTLLERAKFFSLSKKSEIHLTFLDPPFNQDKEYNEWDDDIPEEEYWRWMTDICAKIFALTSDGGAIYFMQREKKTESVLQCLRKTGWTFQNLIIWKKKTSAVPGINRYGKHYQIIAFATKGDRPRVFNRLRIDPPLPQGYKIERENGLYVTDVWDDIRELTSGYFANDEALRDTEGNRLHKQQTPLQPLVRIILSSTKPNDSILDPFTGTGTTLVAAQGLNRLSVGLEIDKKNVKIIQRRIDEERESDSITKFYKDYICTKDLDNIWGNSSQQKNDITITNQTRAQQRLFGQTAIE